MTGNFYEGKDANAQEERYTGHKDLNMEDREFSSRKRLTYNDSVWNVLEQEANPSDDLALVENATETEEIDGMELTEASTPGKV